jgi:biotin transport system substrate-specific component
MRRNQTVARSAVRSAVRATTTPLARASLVVLGGSLLLAASAWVRVPMWPVPMTLQTMIVLLIGLTYGSRLAGATVLAYLLEGAAGLPVFAGGQTLLTVGPTLGYLMGFLLAASVTGALAERGWSRRPLALVAVLLIGDALIFAPGLAWLDVGYVHAWDRTFALGLLPFLPGEAAKLAMAAVLASFLPRPGRE